MWAEGRTKPLGASHTALCFGSHTLDGKVGCIGCLCRLFVHCFLNPTKPVVLVACDRICGDGCQQHHGDFF